MVVTQISDEAKKFAYQTGIRVVVAYGGAPVHTQVSSVGMRRDGVWIVVSGDGGGWRVVFAG